MIPRKHLDPRNRNLLLLVDRSIQDDLGWVTVSAACWPLMAFAESDLFEQRPDTRMVRLTTEGKILVKWLRTKEGG